MARFHCPKDDVNDPTKKCPFHTNFKFQMMDHASKEHGAIYSQQTVSEVNYKRRNKIQPHVN